MDVEERRTKLLDKLENSSRAVTGSKLAESFGVSRQVIVQDIALLRAAGNEILATSRGYITPQDNGHMVSKTIACQHQGAEVKEELKTVIKYGGRIKDVIVEHPIYGELKGLLMIQSKDDLDDFMAKYEKEGAKPLSVLTEGVHLHTIEALNHEVLELIEEKLRENGFLLTEY